MEVKEKLIRNAIKCNSCVDIIESKHRHDFVSCKCGNVFVDGGLEYLRRGWAGGDLHGIKGFTELSEYAVVPEPIWE